MTLRCLCGSELLHESAQLGLTEAMCSRLTLELSDVVEGRVNSMKPTREIPRLARPAERRRPARRGEAAPLSHCIQKRIFPSANEGRLTFKLSRRPSGALVARLLPAASAEQEACHQRVGRRVGFSDLLGGPGHLQHA